MDIMARGVMVPIEFDEEGNVLDGYHRLQICKELGIEDYPKIVRTGMSDEDKRTHARKLNMARRQITKEQRQAIVRQQILNNPEKSDRQIASRLGIDHKTVGAQRREMEAGGEIPHLKESVGADGKRYPRYSMPTPQEKEMETGGEIPHLKESVSADSEWYPCHPAPQPSQFGTLTEADEIIFEDMPELLGDEPSHNPGQPCNLCSSTEADEVFFEDEPKRMAQPERDCISDKLHDAISTVLNVPHDEAALHSLEREIGYLMREIYINGLNDAIERLTLFRDRIQNFEDHGHEEIEYSEDYNREEAEYAD